MIGNSFVIINTCKLKRQFFSVQGKKKLVSKINYENKLKKVIEGHSFIRKTRILMSKTDFRNEP